MSHFAALLDVNVLYPAPMRDVFMQLAITDFFREMKRPVASRHRNAWLQP